MSLPRPTISEISRALKQFRVSVDEIDGRYVVYYNSNRLNLNDLKAALQTKNWAEVRFLSVCSIANHIIKGGLRAKDNGDESSRHTDDPLH